MNINEKFKLLGVENAPGQEGCINSSNLDIRGLKIPGIPVDFSHGDVDAFPPIPGSLDLFVHGFQKGSKQAYTKYRGSSESLSYLSEKLTAFFHIKICEENIIITPGTQGALFLSVGSLISPGDKIAIVSPDYFANQKLAEFFDAEIIPVHMEYLTDCQKSGINLEELKMAFEKGAKVFLFSNPNNPTGAVYSFQEISEIAAIAKQYDVTIIVDELYSRQIFKEKIYTHLCAMKNCPENVITIIGPSKTESLSGFRLGVAVGPRSIINRMEKLQAIVSLRAPGYSQAVLKCWFSEPRGFMENRIKQHQFIRDNIVDLFKSVPGVSIRSTDGGSYVFPTIPDLDVDILTFVKIVKYLADVTVTPGTEFGRQYVHSIRLNFSQNPDAAIAAVKRIIEVLERYRSKK